MKYENLYGNKNAEKYKPEEVTELLSKVLARSEETDCYFILNAIKGILTKSQWDWFNEKYKEDKSIIGTIKTIQANCEQNLVNGMLNGKVKETASIFLLKAKYGYIDKQVNEVEHKGSININLNFPE